jgi:hypothetical protein
LVHTPPRPEHQLGQEHGVIWEVENAANGQNREILGGSLERRRVITRLADGSPTLRLGNRIRERGSVERRWMTDGLHHGQLESGLD